jgi:GTP-binding protein HflX
LKYLLPRLIAGQDSAFSRLAGGIGGRGPGETKLETDRRRVRDRINRLEKEIEAQRRRRYERRKERLRQKLPLISIVGYTNAGKSTLLNKLTASSVLAEQRMFATLDPASRRLRLPREQEVIINDTVGFIRDLPPGLVNAFRATLEEISDSNLLIHLIDVSNPRWQQQIDSVDRMLAELDLDHIPRLVVFNKADRVESEQVEAIVRQVTRTTGRESLAISATRPETFGPLLEKAGLVLSRNLSDITPEKIDEVRSADRELVESK